MKLGFLGVGNMAGAIVRGLVAAGYDKASIYLFNRTQSKAQLLAAELAVCVAASVTELLEAVDVLVLGVKPLQVMPLLEALQPKLGKKLQAVISLAISVRCEQMRAVLPEHVAVFRAMPNTPVQINEGITALCVDSMSSQALSPFVTTLFERLGEVTWLDTDEAVDRFSAFAGSGPAYLYYIIEQLGAAATSLGLSLTEAQRLSQQLARGAVLQMQQLNLPAKALREAVTSPGGSTAAALAELEKAELEMLFAKAMAAAVARTEAIGREMNSKE